MGEGYSIRIDSNLDDAVRSMPELQARAREAADDIASAARSIAPRDSGDYASSITVQKTKAGWRVFAADHKAAWLEFGVPNRGIPARFILRRAVKIAGLKFKKRGA